jgi:hypothetical protein
VKSRSFSDDKKIMRKICLQIFMFFLLCIFLTTHKFFYCLIHFIISLGEVDLWLFDTVILFTNISELLKHGDLFRNLSKKLINFNKLHGQFSRSILNKLIMCFIKLRLFHLISSQTAKKQENC